MENFDLTKTIYLDNAATTPMSPLSANVLNESLNEFLNPSARYNKSAALVGKMNESRSTIKKALGVGEGGELYFTSGGTESNNTVLFGAKKKKTDRIIVSEGEHDSVYAAANELKARGFDVRFAPIRTDGSVDIDAFKELLSEDTALVSVMHVSNETGAVNDISKLVKLTKRVAPDAIFHSDGVQAFAKTKYNLASLGVDAYTVTAHKLHGPKGIGALYLKKSARVKPLLYGGGQESGFRSGTESYPLIRSFAVATSESFERFDEDYSKILRYREYFCEQLTQRVDDIVIITPLKNSIPHILSVAFADIRGEVLVHVLEEDGILVGTGSACATHHENRFKKLFGLDRAHMEGIIRFSFARENDLNEIDRVMDSICRAVEKLRLTKRI